MDLGALAVMVGPRILAALTAAWAAAAARVDRHLLLAPQEQAVLAALAGQGGLQALGVREPRHLHTQLMALAAAAVVVVLQVADTSMAVMVAQFR